MLRFGNIHRATLHGRRPHHDSVQAKAAPTQIGHSGETGEDADGGSRGCETAGAGNEGAAAVDDDRESNGQKSPFDGGHGPRGFSH